MSLERRRYSRFPVHTHEADVLVQIGSEILSARVVDTSASGMQICLPLSGPQPTVEGSVWVQTQAGCTEARVVRVVVEAEGIRLGLVRQTDVPSLPLTQIKKAWWQRLPTFAQWDGRMLGLGLGLVACVLLAITGIFFLLLPNASGTDLLHAVGLGSGDDLTKAEIAAQRIQGQLFQDLFRNLPANHIARELRLTPQQEAEFRRVHELARHLRQSRAATDAELAPLYQAHDRLRSILTPSQSGRWQQLVEAELARTTHAADRQRLVTRLFSVSPARSGAAPPASP